MLSPMNYLVKIILSPLIAAQWVQALDAASKGDYEKTILALNRVDRHVSGINVEYHLLRMHALHALGLDAEAINNQETALRLISVSSKYNIDEKSYLKCYVSKHYKSESPRTSAAKDCENFKASNVRKSLRLSFPVQVG